MLFLPSPSPTVPSIRNPHVHRIGGPGDVGFGPESFIRPFPKLPIK